MNTKTSKTKCEGKVINSGPKLGERYITSLLQTMLSFGLLQQDDKDDYHRKVLYIYLTPPGDACTQSHPIQSIPRIAPSILHGIFKATPRDLGQYQANLLMLDFLGKQYF